MCMYMRDNLLSLEEIYIILVAYNMKQFFKAFYFLYIYCLFWYLNVHNISKAYFNSVNINSNTIYNAVLFKC